MSLEDDLVYRTSARPLRVNTQEEYVRDEAEYSSLVEVQKMLSQALEGLYKDFNAFDISEKEPSKVLVEIAARQEAYRIMAPLLELVSGVVERIQEKNRS